MAINFVSKTIFFTNVSYFKVQTSFEDTFNAGMQKGLCARTQIPIQFQFQTKINSCYISNNYFNYYLLNCHQFWINWVIKLCLKLHGFEIPAFPKVTRISEHPVYAVRSKKCPTFFICKQTSSKLCTNKNLFYPKLPLENSVMIVPCNKQKLLVKYFADISNIGKVSKDLFSLSHYFYPG